MKTAQETKKTEMKTETVYYGDCLKHLKQWILWNRGLSELPMSLADLIYLDPPWNSKANYNILFGQGKGDADDCPTAQETAFVDIWQWGKEAEKRTNLICGDVHHDDYFEHLARKSIRGIRESIGETGMLAYLSYMAERLALLRMLLKETGSIYLHCDPTASHYLKMIMDDIFGLKTFRNEIVWCYKTGGTSKRWFGRKHDTILCYGKSRQDMSTQRSIHGKTKFNLQMVKSYLDDTKWKEYHKGADELGFQRDEKGMYRMVGCRDWWEDIPLLHPRDSERTGYATQKPLALLKRIIQASTNEGDVVLDPFCGCGTAVVAAAMLKRKFVGIDISLFSVETVTYGRLNKEARMAEEDIQIRGIPEDLESARRLAKDDPFAFEIFAVEACRPGMVANKDQRRDKGIDGRGFLLHPVKEKGKKKRQILAQVKAGKPTPSHVRDFANVIRDTKGAVAGVFITVERNWWTEDMREIAYRQGTFKHEHSADEYPRLQHWHVGQFYYKTSHLRLPFLPEMADPLSGKEMTSMKQTGFLTRQYGI